MKCDYCGIDLADKEVIIKVFNFYNCKYYYVCSRRCADRWLEMKYGAFYRSNLAKKR